MGKQCMGSVSSVYTILLLQTYRSTEGHQAVVGQCQASGEAVYNQCPISMSEIFK